ncbi:hypothetical protein D3C78_1574930 [compost metagenome]
MLSLAFTLAPAPIKARAAAMWLPRVATSKGVRPLSSRASMGAPWASSRVMAATSSRPAAWCKGVETADAVAEVAAGAAAAGPAASA